MGTEQFYRVAGEIGVSSRFLETFRDENFQILGRENKNGTVKAQASCTLLEDGGRVHDGGVSRYMNLGSRCIIVTYELPDDGVVVGFGVGANKDVP